MGAIGMIDQWQYWDTKVSFNWVNWPIKDNHLRAVCEFRVKKCTYPFRLKMLINENSIGMMRITWSARKFLPIIYLATMASTFQLSFRILLMSQWFSTIEIQWGTGTSYLLPAKKGQTVTCTDHELFWYDAQWSWNQLSRTSTLHEITFDFNLLLKTAKTLYFHDWHNWSIRRRLPGGIVDIIEYCRYTQLDTYLSTWAYSSRFCCHW